VSDSRNGQTPKKENVEQNSNIGADKEELENILEKISESSGRKEVPVQKSEKPEEIIKKPAGIKDQPEDLEGMLNKLTEKTQQRRGIFQRILDFFKKS
jgi:hypothetical protein